MLEELIRQAKRRRTLYSLLAVAVIPLIIVVALYVNGAPGPDSQPSFVDVAARSGLNATLFILVATSQFLLVVVVALFSGDSVASEAQWGSLRYLLVRPIGRGRLLRVKLAVAAIYATGAALIIPVVGLAAGTLAFGWKGVSTPLGGGLSAGQGLQRLVLAELYILAMMGCVVGLAFLFSTLTDAPLAAVGGATVLIVVSQVLDAVTALGVVRSFLPTHYWFSWVDLLQTPVVTDQVGRGLLSALPWTIIPLGLAFRHFSRKDILS